MVESIAEKTFKVDVNVPDQELEQVLNRDDGYEVIGIMRCQPGGGVDFTTVVKQRPCR